MFGGVHVGVVEWDGGPENGRHTGCIPEVIVRPRVGTRPVFTGELEPQLVGGAGREEGDETTVHGVGVVFLQAVGAAPPVIHVERPVLLLRPRVVVLEGQIVPVREPEVELGESRTGVVGTRDRTEIGG